MNISPRLRRIGDRLVGPGQPVYVIGEIGINHNGDLRTAMALIDAAKAAGMDAVKFQKRVEFGAEDYRQIDDYCREIGIDWFASPWDVESVDFLGAFSPSTYKVASASLTDDVLLRALRATGRTIILSTGMSTPAQIRHAVEVLGSDNIVMLHATSTYPAPPEQLNLRMIKTLEAEYPNVPIGYSGHEVGLQTTLCAVALGAVMVERHITLDRAMWGSDQSASVEPEGMRRLVRDIRVIEAALGDGVKQVYDGERNAMAKLRRVSGVVAEAEAARFGPERVA
ncbi:MAG: N-acetylneuraminate synthase family protein [Actinobacteria bacterium]|nr:N-acetylneuraminate synthase family protein [Actinomycetota bacterium]